MIAPERNAERRASYRASFARADITPPLKHQIPLQGYYTEKPRIPTSVHAPLELHLLLLEDAAYNKLLVVSADIFGFDGEVVRHIRTALRRWGIPPDFLILNASHTHYAPGTVGSIVPSIGEMHPEYASNVASALIQRLPQLYANLEPCRISQGVTQARIGCNRRTKLDNGKVAAKANPTGYYHTHTPFLRVRFEHSRRTVLMINHGCHPTGLDMAPVMSSGYPGYLRSILTKSDAIDHVMFLQGAAGTTKPAVQKNGHVVWPQKKEEVVKIAGTLAKKVAAGLSAPLEPVDGLFFARQHALKLPLQPPPPKQVFENLRNRSDEPFWVREWADICSRRLYKLENPSSPPEVPFEVQLVGIGDSLCFLTLPGEPTGELARNVLNRSPIPSSTFFLGYTNGLQSYIPTRRIIEDGGYEAETSQRIYGWSAPYSSDIEQILTRTIRDLAFDWKKQTGSTGPGPRVHDGEQRAFFCLSTGRCGTKTLASILQTASNAQVYHHPRPFLVEETLQAYHNEIDKSETFRYARASTIAAAWRNGEIFGELDHNMTPFAPVIAEELPEAKFLILVRNPWDFVRSAMRRKYYRGHVWDHGRLRPKPGHPDFQRWNNLAPFEKVCWLWNSTYEHIHEYLKNISDDRYEIIQFNDLIATPHRSEAVFEFLDLEGFGPDTVRNILSQKLNRQNTGNFPRPEEWSESEHSIVWSQCGSNIRRFDVETPYDGPR